MSTYDGWNYFGTAAVVTALPQALSTTRQLINVRIPKDALVESVEASMDTLAGGASAAVLAIFRDAAGDIPHVGDGPSSATQDITTGTTTATDGGCRWPVGVDHHENADSSVNETMLAEENLLAQTVGPNLPTTQYADLWVSVQLNAGTANLNRLTVNWRC